MDKIKCAMLIDDQRASNLLHEMVIEDAHCIDKTLIFNSPLRALDYLSNSQEKNFLWPSIIFLDINMPKMDGWEFLNHFKEAVDDAPEKTIVVLLTTSFNAVDKKKARDSDVIKEYLQKPLDDIQLKRLVEKYF